MRFADILMAAATQGGGATPVNSHYVAVGDSGKLGGSETAASWAQETSNFGTETINAVGSGNGVFVAVGNCAAGAPGKISTAPVPSVGPWTSRTSNTANDVNIQSLKYGGGLWVAGCSNSKVITSSDDGVTWAVGAATNISDGFGISGIAYDGSSVWIATSNGDGTLKSSTAPATSWTSRTSQFGVTSIRGATHDGTNFIIVGSNGKISTSPDGVTWTARTSDVAGNHINAVAAGNGNVIAVAGSGKLCRSTDNGVTWSALTDIFAGSTILGITYGNGVWVAVGASGKLATSTNNGDSFSNVTSSFSTTQINGVAYG